MLIRAILGDITIDSKGSAVVFADNKNILGGKDTAAAGVAVISKVSDKYYDYEISTVGPFYTDGGHGEPEELAACYYNSLNIAKENGIRSISFPSIATGIEGYPVTEASEVAMGAVRRFLEFNNDAFDLIEWICKDKETLEAYSHQVDVYYNQDR